MVKIRRFRSHNTQAIFIAIMVVVIIIFGIIFAAMNPYHSETLTPNTKWLVLSFLLIYLEVSFIWRRLTEDEEWYESKGIAVIYVFPLALGSLLSIILGLIVVAIWDLLKLNLLIMLSIIGLIALLFLINIFVAWIIDKLKWEKK